jgi:hypothetical protein
MQSAQDRVERMNTVSLPPVCIAASSLLLVFSQSNQLSLTLFPSLTPLVFILSLTRVASGIEVSRLTESSERQKQNDKKERSQRKQEHELKFVSHI